MISTFPAVQFNIRDAKKIACIKHDTIREEKRSANRRHRRALNRAVRLMSRDPERWWDEGFNAPSLSSWELC